MKIICTYNHNFKDFILKQLKELKANFELEINDNISIFSTRNYIEFYNKLIQSKIIFLHHMHPVNFEFEISENFTETLNNIIITNINNYFDDNKTYSIQIRIIDNNVKKIDIINNLENIINLKKDNKNPEQVLSIFIYKNICYIGFNETKYNLSKWNGGEVRYNYNNCISRAEFKLLELFENIDIDFSEYKTALDLGCSPGGWSKVLLEKGLKVNGIDPAEVDDRLNNYKNFKHYKLLSENFKKINKDNYDIIVNDMKMDYLNSIKVVKSFIKNLNKNGIIIMTIKLFKNDNIYEVINKIKDHFTNIFLIKQLYHNRSEFTIVIKKY